MCLPPAPLGAGWEARGGRLSLATWAAAPGRDYQTRPLWVDVLRSR